MSRRAKRPVLLRNKHRATCPDCIERGDLDGKIVGAHPRRYCENCKGQGMATFAEVVGTWPKADLWTIRKVKEKPEAA